MLVLALFRTGKRRWQVWGGLLAILLLAQIGLGMANVLLGLPLAVAIAHNLGAALLLTATLAINIRMHRLHPHVSAAPALRGRARTAVG
jgi:cytochrome c oxidase assembly protein subunit 15